MIITVSSVRDSNMFYALRRRKSAPTDFICKDSFVQFFYNNIHNRTKWKTVLIDWRVEGH